MIKKNYKTMTLYTEYSTEAHRSTAWSPQRQLQAQQSCEERRARQELEVEERGGEGEQQQEEEAWEGSRCHCCILDDGVGGDVVLKLRVRSEGRGQR